MIQNFGYCCKLLKTFFELETSRNFHLLSTLIRNLFFALELNEANERSPVKFEGNTFLKFVNSISKM